MNEEVEEEYRRHAIGVSLHLRRYALDIDMNFGFRQLFDVLSYRKEVIHPKTYNVSEVR
jgi:hypothetical protein